MGVKENTSVTAKDWARVEFQTIWGRWDPSYKTGIERKSMELGISICGSNANGSCDLSWWWVGLSIEETRRQKPRWKRDRSEEISLSPSSFRISHLCFRMRLTRRHRQTRRFHLPIPTRHVASRDEPIIPYFRPVPLIFFSFGFIFDPNFLRALP